MSRFLCKVPMVLGGTCLCVCGVLYESFPFLFISLVLASVV